LTRFSKKPDFTFKFPRSWCKINRLASNGPDLMTTANKVTCARILLVPLFVALILCYGSGGNESCRLGAIACFALASVGDFLDGYIARHYNQRTELGAILDATADKLLLVSAMVALCVDSHQRFVPIPVWLVLVVVTRELILLGGMTAIHFTAGKFVARPHLAGKLATVLQMATVLWTLLRWPAPALPFLTIASALFVLISGFYYLHDFTRQFHARTVGN
jgi:CDP-diacylglycerol--glycerol-3-phosphate 3-phosphatidyltransferase